MDCPICFEECSENKYEINCGAKSKHVICNSCESTMRLATRPEYRVRKGQTTRQIKCPLCRGVEMVENPRSAESYKAELESLYALLNPERGRVAPAPVAPVVPVALSRPLPPLPPLPPDRVEAIRQARRNRRIERQQLWQGLVRSMDAAPVHVPVPVPVAAPAALAPDTGTQAIWCIYKRNGVACPTKSKTKRKCCTRVAVGVYCQEKVCRACNKCAWH